MGTTRYMFNLTRTPRAVEQKTLHGFLGKWHNQRSRHHVNEVFSINHGQSHKPKNDDQRHSRCRFNWLLYYKTQNFIEKIKKN